MIIKNSIITNFIHEDNIDVLCLINNRYSNVNLRIGKIKRLEITHNEYFFTKEILKFIDCIKDNGILVLHKIIIDNLDCSRFKEIVFKECSINFLKINTRCKISYDTTTIIDSMEEIQDDPVIVVDTNELIYCTKNYYDGIYTGYFLNDMRYDTNDGTLPNKSIMTYNNGDVYIGGWKNDKRHGTGTMKFGNGNVYIGNWDSYDFNYDGPCGHGTLEYANGNIFNGEFKKYDSIREGVMIYTNGDEYRGKLIGDEKYDYGVMMYRRDDKICMYEGNWFRDKKYGRGVLHYIDGSRYEGNFKDDLQNGSGILYGINHKNHKDIVLKSGEWNDGILISNTITSSKSSNFGYINRDKNKNCTIS